MTILYIFVQNIQNSEQREWQTPWLNLANQHRMLKGWYGEGGGKGVQDGEHVYTCGDSCWCMAKPIQYYKFKKNCDMTVKNKTKQHCMLRKEVGQYNNSFVILMH